MISIVKHYVLALFGALFFFPTYLLYAGLKSPASRLFAQRFIHAQIKENIKAARHWPLWWEFTCDRWIPRTKGQYRGKCIHFMTSSCTFGGINLNDGWFVSLHNKNTFFMLFISLFVYAFTYVLKSYNATMTYFHVSNSVLIFAKHLCTLIFHRLQWLSC